MRLSHLGDVVHALPVFHALRRARPDARIAWAIEPEFAGLLEGLPGLERVVRFERRSGAAAWPRLAAELARFAPTWVVDAQANLKSAAVVLCAGPARRSGLALADWREKPGAVVLSDRAPAVARDVPDARGGPHALDRMLALARHVGGVEAEADFDLGISAEETTRASEQARAAFGELPREGDALLLVSGAGDVRSWPAAHFEELARRLAGASAHGSASNGRRVFLLGGPAEREVGAELARALADVPAARSWVGQRGLRELAAFLALAARAGAVAVGVDSGPLHLAAASGLPVVALEGPQSHARTGPWPVPERDGALPRHAVVRSREAPACAPCFARRCGHAEGPVCMTRLAPADVVDALERVLRASRARRAPPP